MKNILFLSLVLFGFTSCQSISRQDNATRIVETQSVPVFSEPAGAKVFVDGVEVGITPTSLTLVKSRDHTVIIRKEGYVFQTILLTLKTDGDDAASRLTPEVIDVVLEPKS